MSTLLKKTRITWLGHATVLVQTAAGTNILIDPFIAQNPKYPQAFILPSKIQYILLTHGHGDHISDAVPVAQKHGSTVVAIYELAAYVGGKGVADTVGMNLGGTVQLEDVAATMVEAKHSSARALPCRRHRGLRRYAADPRAVSAQGGDASHWRPFHHGTERSRAGGALSRSGNSFAAALRHIPAAERYARAIGRIGRSRR